MYCVTLRQFPFVYFVPHHINRVNKHIVHAFNLSTRVSL